MLILTRRKGERVIVGDVTFEIVSFSAKVVRVNTITNDVGVVDMVPVGTQLSIGKMASVVPLEVRGNQVKLGFDAPRNVEILREELTRVGEVVVCA